MFIGRGIGVCGGRDGEQNINHQGWFLCAMHTLIQAQAPGFPLVNNGGPSTYLSRFLTNVFFFLHSISSLYLRHQYAYRCKQNNTTDVKNYFDFILY